MTAVPERDAFRSKTRGPAYRLARRPPCVCCDWGLAGVVLVVGCATSGFEKGDGLVGLVGRYVRARLVAVAFLLVCVARGTSGQGGHCAGRRTGLSLWGFARL